MIEKRILYAMAIITLGVITFTTIYDFTDVEAKGTLPNYEKVYGEHNKNPTCQTTTDMMKKSWNSRGDMRGVLANEWILLECWK
jgi:hypothetical protein